MDTKVSCGILIKQIHNKLEKDANNILRAHDLTLAQVNALLLISEKAKKQMTLKELEKEMHVAQSTTVGIVNRLEQRGYVLSFGDNLDKRVKNVKITQKGEQCCLDANENMMLAEESLLSGLDDYEKEMFNKLLLKVWTSIDK